MKQIFFALVLANVGYLLLQEYSGRGPLEATTARKAPVQATGGDALVFVEVAPGISRAGLADESVPAIATDPVPAAIDNPVTLEAPVQPAAAATVALQEAAVPPASCVIAGPFRKRRDADSLVKQLADAGIAATRQPRDAALLPDYMVYIGPASSVRDARALAERFKARKMDAQLITKGSLRNGLSLGVFSRAPLARSLQAELRGDGFKAAIETITRNRSGYQVRAALPQMIRNRLIAADTPLIDCPAESSVPVATTVAAAS